MARRLFLKPAKGLAVWLPARGRNIFPEGEIVAVDTFVARCIAEGSLVESKGAAIAKTIKQGEDK